MRFLSRSLVVVSLFTAAVCCSMRAKADTISVFSLSGNLQYGTANGTLTVDTTTGVLNSGTVTASYNGQSETLGTISSSSGSNGLYTIALTTASTGDTFYLDLPISTLVNYGGGSIDTTNYNSSHASYLSASSGLDYATSGTLNLTSTSRTATSTAVTPEVASWVMMLTGMVGLVVVARRQRPAAQEQGVSA